MRAPGRNAAAVGRELRRGWRRFAQLYWGTGICDDIPALAWFLLASLVPLALGLTAMLSIALGDYAAAHALATRAGHVLPRDTNDQLLQLLLRTHSSSPLLAIGSLVAMVWVSSGAVGVVERVLSRLLGSPARVRWWESSGTSSARRHSR